MSATQELTITLPTEIVEAVKSKVDSGEFASESEVLRASFLYFAQADDSFGMDDETFDEFLRKEAVPVLEAMDKDPSLGLSIEQVRTNLATTYKNFRKAG